MNISIYGGGYQSDVEFYMNNSFTTISKIKTFLILPNNETSNVNSTAGQVRFTAGDEKFILINVNVTDDDSSSIFNARPGEA